MRSRPDARIWPLVLIGGLGLIWLIFLSGPGSRLSTHLFSTVDTSRPALARVVELIGVHASVVRGPRVVKLTAPLEHPIELFDGDRLETDGTTEAVLVLSSQDELRVRPKSVVSVELWNERDPTSPIYVHALAGDVTCQRTGVRGRAYVVRQGRLFLVDQRPGERRAPLLIARGTNAPDLHLGDSPLTAEGDLGQDQAPSESADETAGKDEPSTLANEYVDEVIASRQSQFQKCWLTRLKDNPKLKGTLTVQFEITRRGKVREVKVTDSSLGDERLGACVATVVERLPFRSFSGPDISVSYPITFE